MPNTNKNLQLIQVLRGIASLLVVLLHCTANSSESLHQTFLGNFFSFGGAGVDIFFVLSGFIITYTNLKFIGQPDYFNFFIKRRIVRIYPTYWIIISLFLLLQVMLPSFYKTHFSFDIKNILSTFLLFPGHAMVNGVSWTLSYEIFFYILFSLSFFIPAKKWSFYLAMLYAVVIILLPASGYNFKNENSWLNLLTYPMNVEFFMGVVAAVVIPKISQKTAMPLIITGIIIFLLNAILSNSLYLIHLPLVAAAYKILFKFNVNDNIVIHCIIILIVFTVCYCGILFYKFVEKPIITKLNSLRRIKVANEI